MTPTTTDQVEPVTGKPPISEKKLASNRANAQKSTGPRTDAGKAASRRNSAKHFMTGKGAVLPVEMDDEIEHEIAVFAARLQPVDDYDWGLVREAAIGSVRFDRLVQVQEANLVLNVNKATRAWDEDREDRVVALASVLNDDPAHAVRMLKRFTEGCDYLWDAWDALATRLDRAGFWNQDDYRHALRLLGWDAAPSANDGGTATTMTLCALGAHIQRVEIADEVAAFFDLDPDQGLTLLPAPDESLDALLGLIEQQKEDLRTLADRLWDLNDARDRSSAPTRAQVDLSPEGKRLHRYEQDALRLRDRALRDLNDRRNEAGPPHPPRSIAPSPRPAPSPPRNEPKADRPGPDASLIQAQNEPTPFRQSAALLALIRDQFGHDPSPDHPEGPPHGE